MSQIIPQSATRSIIETFGGSLLLIGLFHSTRFLDPFRRDVCCLLQVPRSAGHVAPSRLGFGRCVGPL